MGDMKELGPTEIALHQGLANLDAMAAIDVVHTVGPMMAHLYEALPEAKRGSCAETSADLAQIMSKQLDSGDVVLVKGSLSMGLARVVDAIRKMGHPVAPNAQDISQ